jgi:hypothetical protein
MIKITQIQNEIIKQLIQRNGSYGFMIFIQNRLLQFRCPSNLFNIDLEDILELFEENCTFSFEEDKWGIVMFNFKGNLLDEDLAEYIRVEIEKDRYNIN